LKHEGSSHPLKAIWTTGKDKNDALTFASDTSPQARQCRRKMPMPHLRKYAAAGQDDDVTPEELYAQARYDACHDDDDFASLKRRAEFSREAAGLYRQWLQAASRTLANDRALDPPVYAEATSAAPGKDTSG